MTKIFWPKNSKKTLTVGRRPLMTTGGHVPEPPKIVIPFATPPEARFPQKCRKTQKHKSTRAPQRRRGRAGLTTQKVFHSGGTPNPPTTKGGRLPGAELDNNPEHLHTNVWKNFWRENVFSKRGARGGPNFGQSKWSAVQDFWPKHKTLRLL